MLPGIEPVGAVHLHIATCNITTCNITTCHVSRVAPEQPPVPGPVPRHPGPLLAAPLLAGGPAPDVNDDNDQGISLSPPFSPFLTIATRIESFMQTVTVYRIFWPKKFIPIETEL